MLRVVMAVRSSQHPPKSIPPVTDEVDSGWPRAVEADAGTRGAVKANAAPVAVPAPEAPKADTTALPSAFEPAFAKPRSRSLGWILLPAALLGGWFVLRPSAPEPRVNAAPVRTTVEAAKVGAVAPAPVAPAAPLPVETSRVEPQAVVPAVASAASAALAAVPGSFRASAVSVKLVVTPPEGRFFRHGKPVGRSGVVVTLEPTERYRFYEVVLSGYATRKLVVDGSETEMRVSLRPEVAPR